MRSTAGDELSSAFWANTLAVTPECGFEDSIILFTNFHSASVADETGTWAADKDYYNVIWYMVKVNGNWVALTFVIP